MGETRTQGEQPVSMAEVVEALRECVEAIQSGSINHNQAEALERSRALLARVNEKGE
jgi:hypothetical protein